MESKIVNLPQTKSQAMPTLAVQRGRALLKGIKLSGWPPSFEVMGQAEIARNHILDLQETRMALEAEMKPAAPEYVMTKIELLQSRYFEKTVSQDDGVTEAIQTELAAEWLEDLENYPAALIDEACRNWRQSSRKYAPPSAGVLMESVNAEYYRRIGLLRKCESVLKLIEGAA